MAVPTIAAIAPTAGHTGGRTLLEVTGTGFTIHPPPAAADNLVPEAPPGVSVTFGGVAARDVRVVSSTLLYVVTPVHDAGAVDVVIRNLTTGGAPVAGELVTAVAGYTYQRPDLTVESDLARILRALIIELRRQITPNTDWPVHTDYDDTTGDQLSITKAPELPGLILARLGVDENAFYAVREPQTVSTGADTFATIAPPTTVDLKVTIVGVADHSVVLLNLLAATKRFFRKNIYLEVARDAANPGKGTVSFEMDWEDDPSTEVTISSSLGNVRHFVGTITVRGVDIEHMAGLPLGGPGIAAGDDREAVIETGKTADAVVLEPTGVRT